MSEVVDSKVVELKFNNQEFEKNVKTSLSTIEKLKQNLNFDNVTKGVNTLNSALNLVSLKGISNQVGELVGLVDKSVTPVEAAINTIGSTITNTVGGAIKSVIGQIKSGGMSRAFNIEAAKFSLQGLGIEWDTVKDSINNAVSGTAYGLDQAAKAAAVLSASGIGVDNVMASNGDTLPELERDLKAVSGISAQTGQDFDRIADVFSTIANNGKLMTMQVRQFSTYGLNATADLANYYGVATSDIEDMLQKGEISANDFFDMMYSKYWENAAKANDTVTGVESNIKAALGRIGQAFLTPIIENEGPLNKFLQSYLGAINTIAGKLKAIGSKDENGNDISGKLTSYVDKELIKYLNALTEWLSDFTDKKAGGLLRVWRSVYRFLKGTFKLLQSLINYLEKIGDAFQRTFPAGLPTYLLRLAKKWTEFTNSIYKGSKSLKDRTIVFSTFWMIFKGLEGVIKALKKQIKAIIKGFKEFISELPINPLYIFASGIEVVGTKIGEFKASAKGFKNIFSGIYKIVSAIYIEIVSFITAIIETMQELDINPIRWLGKVLKTLTKGWSTNTDATRRSINIYKIFTTIIGVIVKTLGALVLIIANVINFFGKLVSVISWIVNPIGSAISAIAKFGTEFTKNILDKLSNVKFPFIGVVEWLKKTIENISSDIKNIDWSKYDNLNRVANGIKKIFEKIKEAVNDALSSVIDFFNIKSEGSSSSIEGLHISKALDVVLSGLDGIAGIAITTKDIIVDIVNEITDFLQPGLEATKNLFDDLFGTGTQNNIDATNDKLEETGKKDIFTKITEFFEGIIQSIKDFVSSDKASGILSQIGEWFSNTATKFREDMDLDDDAGVFEVLKASTKVVVGYIVDILEILIDGIGDIISKIADIQMTGDWITVITNFTAIVRNVFIAEIGMALWDIASALKNFKKIYVSTRFSNLAKGIGVFLLSFAGSIGILILSLAAIVAIVKWTKNDPAELDQAVEILDTLVVTMGILAVCIAGLVKNFQTETITLGSEGIQMAKASSVISTLATFMLSFSGSILMLIGAIAALIALQKWATEDEFNNALALVGIMVVGMVGIVEILTQLAKASGPTDSLRNIGITGILLGISGSVFVLAKCIKSIVKLIDKYDYDQVGMASAIVGLMVLMLVGVVAALTGIAKSEDPTNTVSTLIKGGTIIAITIAVRVLVGAIKSIIKLLEDHKDSDVGWAVAIVAAMAGVLLAIVAALTNISKGSMLNDNISQFAQVLQIGAITEYLRMMVNLFEDLLHEIGDADPDNVKEVEKIMAVMAAALLGIITAMTKLAQKSAMPMEDLKGLGVMLAAGGVFLVCLWATIQLFKDLLNAIKDADIQHIQEAEKIMAGMAIALGGIMGEFTYLAQMQGKNAKDAAIGTALEAITEGLFVAAIWALVNLFKDLLNAIKDIDIQHVQEAKEIFIGMVAAYGGMLTAITTSSTIKGAVGSFTGGMSYLGDVVEAIDGGLLYLATIKLAEAFEDFLDAIKDIDDNTIDAAGKTFSSIIVAYGNMIGKESDSATLKGIAGFLTGGMSYLGDFVAIFKDGKIYDTIIDIMDAYEDFIKKVKDYPTSMIESTAKAFKKIITAYVDLAEQFNGVNISIGKIDTDALNEIIEDILQSYVDLVKALVDPDEDDYKPKPESWNKVWDKTFTTSNEEMAKSEAEHFQALYDVGENLTKGVAEGMTNADAETAMKNAGMTVIDWAEQYSKQAADEHSPSRLMRDGVGKNLTAGIAVGMTKYVQPLFLASRNIKEILVNSFKDAKNLALSTMDGFVNDPTITPVVDLSNVQNATSQISDMFNNQSMNLDSDISSITGSLNEIQNQDPNADLMSAINGLKDNINNNYTNYTVNGVTYDDGSNVASAVQDLISAANIQRRM